MLAQRQYNLVLIALLAVSAATTIFGLRFLLTFDSTPGIAAQAPAQWPVSSTIRRVAHRPTLLVFAHPFCECTAATLEQLARVSARRVPGSVQPAITILFARPKGTAWQTAHLWDTARRLPANVMWDEEGREATRFGVRTSGEVLLYDGRGDLLFHGGVTGSRGHSGDNYGADYLLAALNSGRPAHTSHFVFGCALTEARR